MNYSVTLRASFLEYVSICRAIFHGFAVNGIRMPFFSKCIVVTE
ncbi:RAxF-45 family protein [Priestia taiwanensis]|nr:RAxF-45 family protein [Priestia taiwanensis]MBM7362218.1 hypothetical protein [Priestia taiwanensis]